MKVTNNIKEIISKRIDAALDTKERKLANRIKKLEDERDQIRDKYSKDLNILIEEHLKKAFTEFKKAHKDVILGYEDSKYTVIHNGDDSSIKLITDLDKLSEEFNRNGRYYIQNKCNEILKLNNQWWELSRSKEIIVDDIIIDLESRGTKETFDTIVNEHLKNI